ncbi:uncharacterized protein [Ptychodera flava]|uniref:uncharacterized protein n=1 Tax=Ptychodera flava TaxID=63121 RepID=UPI003969BC53
MANIFAEMKVTELKLYLKERGIPASDQKKPQLISLAQKAAMMNLPVISEPDDLETSMKRRRTVKVNETIELELPDVRGIPAKDWSSDLFNLPNVQLVDVLVYLSAVCQFDCGRLRKLKSEDGYQLFAKRHVVEVKLYAHQPRSNYFYVKAKVVPQERQKSQPYVTWVLLDKSCNILSGGCECVADDGRCKHCIALLFALQDFNERHCDRSAETSTDQPCKWDVPRHTSRPMKILEIDFHHQSRQEITPEPTPQYYSPGTDHPLLSDREVEIAIYNLFKNESLHAGVLEVIDPPTSPCTFDNDSTEAQPLTLIQTVDKFKETGNGSCDAFITYLCENTSETDIKEVFHLTSEQSKSSEWFEYRKGRLTASVFHRAVHYQGDDLGNYIVKAVVGEGTFSNEATEYGINCEPVARYFYYNEYKKSHQNAVVVNSGLFISKKYPYLGASPDGIVLCKCCEKGILEIKCPFKYKDMSPEDICRENPQYNCFLDEHNNVKLKETSPWYSQIQGQLAISQHHWCDFVLYTRKGFSVERIYADDPFWKNMLKSLQFFYLTYIVPKILK